MASNYNSRGRAAEVLVDGDRFAVITARELYDDLMRLEIDAPTWEAGEPHECTIGLIADTHDRAAGHRRVGAADAGGRRRHGAARRRLLLAVLAHAVRRRADVARRRVRPQRRRPAGADHARAVGARASSCSSRRTASRSAGGASSSCTTSATCTSGRCSAHEIVVHGHTHQQEMKTRGETLIVNPGEGVRLAASARRSAAMLDLDTRRVEFLTLSGHGVGVADVVADSHHRLRLAVHAAHRAARPRGARLLRDPSADAHRSSGFASGSPRASS